VWKFKGKLILLARVIAVNELNNNKKDVLLGMSMEMKVIDV